MISETAPPSPCPRRLPAEYEPQRAVWLSWPGNPRTWSSNREQAEQAYAVFAAAVSHLQPVELICPHPWQAQAMRRLKAAGAALPNVQWHDWPLNDAWCRDHGPIFTQNLQSGQLEIVDFAYNAWGGKFTPWDADDAIPSRVSELRKLPRHRLPIFGEGGALEVNRQGVLLTTESVWFNPNRNPGMRREEFESAFREFLGVKRTVWLNRGMRGDDTDGHIDTISRFVDDDTVVTVSCERDDPDFEGLEANRCRLEGEFQVVNLPLPAPWMHPEGGEVPLPATYANFLILNTAVLVPTYDQPRADARALGILRELFTGREVMGIPAEVLIQEGGALHCLSMQEPQSPADHISTTGR